MRQRILKPGFFDNEALCALPPHDRLLFAGLTLLADKAGRLEDRPARIRGKLFPYEPALDLEAMLVRLEEGGFILRYRVNGTSYLSLPTFAKHQRPHPKEPQSVIPPPVEKSVRAVEKHGEKCTTVPARSGLPVRSSVPSGPSVPSGSSGSSENGSPSLRSDPAPAVAGPAAGTVSIDVWSHELADDFREAYHGPPPKQLFAQVKPVAKRYGWERTRAALKAVMAETPLEYLNVPKVLAVWVENGGRPPDGRARAPTGVGDRAMAAARSVIERHRRQE